MIGGWVLIVWLALSSIVAAQSEPSKATSPLITLDPLVVTGTLFPGNREQSTSSLTVITSEQIKALQADSVIALLRSVPGLHIDLPGGRGSVSSVYTRGGDPNYTLVLIDGVKVNDPTNSRGGSFDFSTLSVDSIRKIEIVRGPFSSVYGSDAMAGVINFITHRGDRTPISSFTFSGGKSGFHQTLFESRGRSKEVDYSLSGSFLDNGDPVKGSRYKSKAFHVKFGAHPSNPTGLNFVLRFADSDLESFPDDSGGPADPSALLRGSDRRDVRELTTGSEFAIAFLPHWEASLHLGYYDRQEEVNSPGVAPGQRNPIGIPPNSSINDYRRYDVRMNNQIRMAEGLRVSVGVEAQSEVGSSEGSLFINGLGEVPTDFKLERELWGITAEAQVQLSPVLMLQSGLRLDYPEDFSSALSPRFGVSYKMPSTNTRFRASWGEGFKLPSFFALVHPLVGASATGENLVPEKSRGLEVGVIQMLREGSITLSTGYFSNRFKHAIDFQEEPQPKLVNRSEIRAEGIEASIRFNLGRRLDLSSHLSYVKTDIEGTEEPLRNRPKWRGGIIIGWRPIASFIMSGDALYVGKVPDSSIPTGDRDLEAYTRINFALTWKAGHNWNIFLRVENLLDTNYEEAIGFPAPGISPRIGVRASM